MKIIKKYKDYYDYLAGIYGRDDLLVYDRRDGQSIFLTDYMKFDIAFCNNLYRVVHNDGRFYYSVDDLKELFSELFDKGSKSYLYHIFGWVNTNPNYKTRILKNDKFFENIIKIRSTDINKKYRDPILVKGWGGSWVKPISLEQLGFAKVKSAHDAYTELSNFLGWLKDNPPLPDNQTDKEKVVAHGFDLKQSFRHRK